MYVKIRRFFPFFRNSCCRIGIPAIMIRINTYIWPIIKINIKIKNTYDAWYRSRIPSDVFSTTTRVFSRILVIAQDEINRSINVYSYGNPHKTCLIYFKAECYYLVILFAQVFTRVIHAPISAISESIRSHNLRNYLI